MKRPSETQLELSAVENPEVEFIDCSDAARSHVQQIKEAFPFPGEFTWDALIENQFFDVVGGVKNILLRSAEGTDLLADVLVLVDLTKNDEKEGRVSYNVDIRPRQRKGTLFHSSVSPENQSALILLSYYPTINEVSLSLWRNKATSASSKQQYSKDIDESLLWSQLTRTGLCCVLRMVKALHESTKPSTPFDEVQLSLVAVDFEREHLSSRKQLEKITETHKFQNRVRERTEENVANFMRRNPEETEARIREQAETEAIQTEIAAFFEPFYTPEPSEENPTPSSFFDPSQTKYTLFDFEVGLSTKWLVEMYKSLGFEPYKLFTELGKVPLRQPAANFIQLCDERNNFNPPMKASASRVSALADFVQGGSSEQRPTKRQRS